MSPEAIALLALSMVVIWGGLLASALFIIRRPEVETWPPDAPDE